MAKASIITIGDELLIGQVIDTNSAWMATELNKAGIGVQRRVAVGDNREDILYALDQEGSVSDIILLTGGLGPTADDITKPLLCEYFGGNLVMNEKVLEHIRHLFENIHQRPMTDRNIRQAEVPDNCQVIMNLRGTAPGMWFEQNGRIFVSMPGVPHEMKGIMEQAIPMIREKLSTTPIYHKTLVTAGIGESMLADLIAPIEEALPSYIKLAYLPRQGMVRLRLTASGSIPGLKDELESRFSILKKGVRDYLVTDRDEPLEAVVGRLLLEKRKTVCTAESCTGGYISHLITSQPGSSAYYEGSFITYSYHSKERLLSVPRELLEAKGAVSEEVVRQMAEGALANLGADYVMAVSGILGPSGGTPEKPVGTVWMAVGSKGNIKVQRHQFRYDRKRNMEMTALQALNHLRMCLLESD
jgi:nicotinamide-nucleotide amidase